MHWIADIVRRLWVRSACWAERHRLRWSIAHRLQWGGA
jgi:hypothetical protein